MQNMVHENTFKKDLDFNGSKGLVYIGGKVLAFRRDTKTANFPLCIDLPGGGRESNESPFDTFQREAFEEFGISISDRDVVYSSKHQSIIDPTKDSYFIVVKPEKISVTDVVFGDEGVEWMVMTPQEFVERVDGVERQQERVSQYLERTK